MKAEIYTLKTQFLLTELGGGTRFGIVGNIYYDSVSAVDPTLFGDSIFRGILKRNIYRSKNIGRTVTPEQWKSIKDGTFENMFVGDFWWINNEVWRIVDFDYWFKKGNDRSLPSFTQHHVVIMPDNTLNLAKMNQTGTTEGGYVNSYIRGSNGGLSEARAKVISAFGEDHLYVHRNLGVSLMNENIPAGGSWYDADLDLPNEMMIYGCNIFNGTGGTFPVGGNIYFYSIDTRQLGFFGMNLQATRTASELSWWLRDAVSSKEFANVASSGYCDSNLANSENLGVRPVFGITSID